MNKLGICITVGELKEMLNLFTEETEICFEQPGQSQLNFYRLKPGENSRLKFVFIPPAAPVDAEI